MIKGNAAENWISSMMQELPVNEVTDLVWCKRRRMVSSIVKFCRTMELNPNCCGMVQQHRYAMVQSKMNRATKQKHTKDATEYG